MADVFYVHWHDQEAAVHADDLRRAGHTVRYHSAPGGISVHNPLPSAMIISLDRLPSHGREIARWFWQAKKRRSIPLIFVGGPAEKIAALKLEFPHAVFCGRTALPSVLSNL
jgi:hypothetical protein